jgi:hypothetical protein
MLAATLKELVNRGGARLTADADTGRTMVVTNLSAADEAKLDRWRRFEARLSLAVVAAMPADQRHDVGAVLNGNDRSLLQARTG